MDFDIRWPILLAANLLLMALLRMVNDSLTPWGLTLYLPALFLLLPALSLRLPGLLILTSLTALLIDSRSPSTFGTSLILYALAASILYANRYGLRRASLWQWLWVLLATNTTLWLLCTLWLGQGWLTNIAYWLRSMTDLLVSTLILFPVGAWFIRLQLSAYYLTGQSLEPARSD